MAQIAQVGCHSNLNMTGEGKSRCEVTVFVQRINSGAQEADLTGKKVGGCMWLEQQSSPLGNVRVNKNLLVSVCLLFQFLNAEYSFFRRHILKVNV